MNQDIYSEKVYENQLVLANGAELVRCIIKELVGKEVADSIQGAKVNRNVLYTMASAKFNEAIAVQLGEK